MIADALKELQKALQSYLSVTNPVSVMLDNVALMESADKSGILGNKVIITLVNIEEESSLKNGLHYRRTPIGGIEYENPPVYLNLYLLFSANFPTNYSDALVRLGQVIQFFQGQNTFMVITEGDENQGRDKEEIQMSLDLYTMTFEQINHLWGSLGGKQIPFVMYKARLVRITDRRRTGTGSPILEIQTETFPNL